jgi:uncharacterized protein YceK
MSFRTICVALLLSSLPVTGCGTVTNLVRQQPGAGGVSPFGGVRQDLSCIQKAADGEVGFKTHPKSESEQYPQRALMLFCAVDLPLSLIGDILTWPYTVTYTFINQPVPTPPVIIPPYAVPPGPVPVPSPPATPPMPTPTPPPVAQVKAVGQPKNSP